MTNDFLHAFEGRSVFVTGHTGFKGSWLCLWLERLGAQVTGYALAPPTSPSHFEIADVASGLAAHHEADIRDADRLRAAMQQAAPDLVLHLAAQTIVRTGYEEPVETFDVNVMGTVQVLEAVRSLHRPCAVIVVSSDKCYENREQVWGYRESDPLGERDPYGGSKGAAELVVRSYGHSFFPPARCAEHGVKLASARAGNVLGGGDWTATALLTDVVAAVAAGEPVGLRNPKATRPWQHVLQALSGYLTLAARLLESDDARFQSAWNIGPLPGSELTVAELVERFLAEWGEGTWVDRSDPSLPREAHSLRVAIDKALWELDWRPVWSIDEVLRRTADWYRHYVKGGEDMRAIGLEQIARFEEALRGGGPELQPPVAARAHG